jgi:hypothetical protein
VDELIPAPVQPLLIEYRALIERDTFDLVQGCYLHGSIALGAFEPTQGDIDFVAVLNRPTISREIELLADIHQALAKTYPQWQMEGSYLQTPDLGKSADAIALYPCVHDGKFDPKGKHDLNPVTWWLLKTKGIPLWGDPPHALPFNIEWATVRAYSQQNLNTYWRRWAYDPRSLIALNTDWAVEWAVLGILRLLYSLQIDHMTSKIGAGEYGLQALSPKWHRLIQEALRIRRHQPRSIYRLRILRTVDAIRFLRMVIRAGNGLVPS